MTETTTQTATPIARKPTSAGSISCIIGLSCIGVAAIFAVVMLINLNAPNPSGTPVDVATYGGWIAFLACTGVLFGLFSIRVMIEPLLGNQRTTGSNTATPPNSAA